MYLLTQFSSASFPSIVVVVLAGKDSIRAVAVPPPDAAVQAEERTWEPLVREDDATGVSKYLSTM